ncbi:MAG: DUF4296 domain-containing protein [Flavobacteriaceae bacterium]|nr:DUF4296 domain-containing protein [Flavobacteriaceae bacterium]
MKQFVSLFFVVIAIISCQELEFAEKPKPLLDEDTMVKIITDMVIYDAAYSINDFHLREFDKDLNKYLIAKYEIDSTVLSKNIAYYNEKYDENLSIYKRVGENIDQKRDFYDSIRKVTDSIKRIELEKKRDTTDTQKIKKKLLKTDFYEEKDK